MHEISMIIEHINNFLYAYLLVGLLLICGIFYSIKTKFAQLRFLPDTIKIISEKTSGSKISTFKALMISTASRVGTGNIAGVATAIAAGGPGSLFSACRGRGPVSGSAEERSSKDKHG